MSTHSKLLSPDSSPDVVTKSIGVRRVNNLPIVIFGAIMLIFMLLMMIVAMNRASERNQPNPDDSKDVQSSNSFASLIAKDYVGGIIEPKIQSIHPESAQLPLQGLIIERPADLDKPPLPPSIASSDPAMQADQAHIRMLKRQQLEEAIKAKTQVNVVAPRSSGSMPAAPQQGVPKTRDEMLAEMASVRQQINSNLREDPTVAYQARLAQLRLNGQGSNREAGGLAGRGDELLNDTALRLWEENQHQGKQAQDYSRFDSAEGEKRWKLNSEVQKPASPYVLQTGFVIPATLISGINSSLPGQIMAQVSQNIYD